MPANAPAGLLTQPSRRLVLPPRKPYFPTSLSDQSSSPIHLIAQTTISSQSSSGVNAEALRNPLDLPMEINEIKFQVRTAALTGNITTPLLTGASIAASFALDELNLTSGFVPLWCLGKSLRVDCAELDPGGESTLAANFHAHFRWRLPRPLYIAPGQVLVPQFYHLGYIPGNIQVLVSYDGRTLPRGYRPKGTVSVPWAAAYASKVFNAYSVADADSSKETDLVNPHDVPVNVQRMIGRINLLNTSTGGTPYPDNFDFGSDLLTARIFSSRGEPLVPNFSLFHAIFQHSTKSWESEHQMPPHSFYLVELAKAAPLTVATTWYMQAFVSLVGWRDLEVK